MAAKDYAEVQVILNNQLIENDLKEIKKQVEDLKLKALDIFNKEGNSKAFKKIQAEIKKTEGKVKSLERETFDYKKILDNLSASPINDLTRAQKTLAAQIKKTNPNTAEWKQMSEQYKQVTERINSLNEAYKELGTKQNNSSSFQNLADGFNKYLGMAATAAAAITGLSMTLRKCAEAAAKLDDAYSDVMKTTGMTHDQVEELDKELMQIDTRTSREQLLALASTAGKLGISGKEEVLGFVRAAEKIDVALGEDLGEGAIKQMGKMVGVYEKATTALQGKNLEEQMLSLGAAVNELGASSTASEQYLVAFAGRLGGIANQAGLSADQILGFGSALDQDMQAVEMSATAFQKFIMKLLEDPAKMATAAGLEVKQFSELVKTDLNGAIMQVLVSMNQKGGLDSLIPIFQELGLDGARAAGVLSSMANSVDKITTAQNIANQALAEGVSITNEYNVKNNNLEAELEKARNEFHNTTIKLGQSLNPALLTSTKITTHLIKIFAEYGKELAITAGIVGVLAVAIKAKTIWMNAATLAKKIGRGASLAYAAAQALLTGNVKRAAAAWRMMNAAMKANVFIAIASVVATVVIGISNMIKKSRELIAEKKREKELESKIVEGYKEEEAKVRRLTKEVNDNTLSVSQRRKALEELKKIIPDYHASITNEGKLINNNTDALDKYIAKIRETARMEVYKGKFQSLEVEIMEYENKIKELYEEIEEKRNHLGGTTYMGVDPVQAEITNLERYIKVFEMSKNLAVKAQNEILEKIKSDRDLTINDVDDNTIETYEKAVEKLKKSQDDLELELKIQLATEEILQEDYQTQLLISKILFFNKQASLAKKYNEDESEFVKSYIDAIIEYNQDANKYLEDLNNKKSEKDKKRNEKELDDATKKLKDLQKLADNLKADYEDPFENYKIEYNELKELLNKELISNEVYQKALFDLKKKYAKKSSDEIDKNDNLGIREKYNAEKKVLEQYFKDGEKGWEEYELAVKKLRLDYAQEVAKKISEILGQVGGLISSLRDMEMNQAEAQYQADLTAAGNNANKREQIEQNYQQKQLDIKKKYATADMTLQILQATASSALALMQAWNAAKSNPVIFGLFAGLISATYAATVASIIAQRNAIMNTSVSSTSDTSSSYSGDGGITLGMKEGGFAGKDINDNSPMGIYHANEYIAPAWMVRKEPILFARLEKYRQSGQKLSSFQEEGMKAGGYTTTNSNIPTSSISSADIDKFVKAIDKLTTEGVQSYMVYNQFQDFINKQNRFKKASGKK